MHVTHLGYDRSDKPIYCKFVLTLSYAFADQLRVLKGLLFVVLPKEWQRTINDSRFRDCQVVRTRHKHTDRARDNDSASARNDTTAVEEDYSMQEG